MNEAETRRLTRIYERKLAALEELKQSLLHPRLLPENSNIKTCCGHNR